MKPITHIPPNTPQRPGGIPQPIGTSRPVPTNNNNNGSSTPFSPSSGGPPSSSSTVISSSGMMVPTNNGNMMPVYDMATGKLLGLFPLAPG